jgi:hypothetical protein
LFAGGGIKGWALSVKSAANIQQIAVYLDEHLIGKCGGWPRHDPMLRWFYPFIAEGELRVSFL